MYGRIWDKRLRQDITTSERQKGFVPVDGCFQNVNILKSIINSERKKKKAYQIVFLDLAKALDTVTLDSIRKALYKKRISLEVINGVMGIYREAKPQSYTYLKNEQQLRSWFRKILIS